MLAKKTIATCHKNNNNNNQGVTRKMSLDYLKLEISRPNTDKELDSLKPKYIQIYSVKGSCALGSYRL